MDANVRENVLRYIESALDMYGSEPSPYFLGIVKAAVSIASMTGVIYMYEVRVFEESIDSVKNR